MKLGFIGAGKAGCSLARYMMGPQIQICGFYSKTPEHSKRAADSVNAAAFFNLQDVVTESDIIFVTTPDAVIGQVWAQIKELENKQRIRLAGKIFCHMSGSLSSRIFSGADELGAAVCSAHPMLAISGKNTDLTGAFFTLDGDKAAVHQVRQMLAGKGNPTAVIDSGAKKKYHMAASTASNLVVGLAQMAIDALEKCGFSEDAARTMLSPLMQGNIENVCSNGTVQALTGPVERGDWQTVKAHLSELTGEKREIYRLLSLQLLSIAQLKNKTRDYTKLKEILEEKDQ